MRGANATEHEVAPWSFQLGRRGDHPGRLQRPEHCRAGDDLAPQNRWRDGNVDGQSDYGQGITLSPGGQATFVCAGDTALGGGDVLGYGKSLSAGVLVCDSAESGITCGDINTGHGFSITREAYRLF